MNYTFKIENSKQVTITSQNGKLQLRFFFINKLVEDAKDPERYYGEVYREILSQFERDFPEYFL